MEAKKNPKADLNKKTGLFLNIGLVVSLLLVITAFEWRFYDDGELMDLGQVADEFEDVRKFLQPNNHRLLLQKFNNLKL